MLKKLKELPKRKRILVIIGISLVGIIIFGFISAEFTSRPKFCTTCHYMQPYYDSWASSSHKDVPCAKCHYEPGFKSVIKTKTVGLIHLITYITEFYKGSKPMAEITDVSCLQSGCHEKRLLSGKEKFNRVYFDHAPHLTQLRRDKKLRCTSCHSQIVQGDHMKVTESTCFLCHFKAGPGDPKIHGCSFCHDAPTRENTTEDIVYDHSNVVKKNIACERCHTEMVVGDGAVPHENCYNCHMDQERLSRIDEIDFMHKTHITDHKIECQQCHTSIQHKLPEKDELHLLDCSGCHIEPHKAQIELFTGQGGYNVHKVPNPMFMRSITCKGCHVFHEQSKDELTGGQTFKASKNSCQNCHGKGFSKLLNQWKKVSLDKLNVIFKDYKKAQQEINATSSRNKKKALQLLEKAKYNIDLVKFGKSVHNVQFADELLRAAHNNISQALKLVSAKWTLTPYPETSKIVPAECNTCHFGIEVQTKSIYGLEFSHKKHVVGQKQKCTRCHSNDRRHGELTMTKSKCATCHHNEETDNCTSCHTLQQSVYTGTLKFEDFTIEQDVMSEAGVECTGCHNYEENKSILPKAENCIACHEEESYKEIYQTWRDNTTGAVKSIKEWLNKNRYSKLTAEQKKQVEQIKKLLEIIELDGSEGVHNPEFYESVLREAQARLNKIIE